MVADILHQDMYMYDVYAEYLNKIGYYSLNSNMKSLSIRYYKQNIPLTKGIHNSLDVVTTSKYSRTYDIFDFVPVLESAPLTYSVLNDENNQGVIRKTEGMMTIVAIIEPLPGDILNYYQNDSTEEFFSVDEVNFIHAIKDLNIYQINFSTSNWYKSSVDKLNINEHYYYMKEFRKFYSSDLYEDYAFLLENRNDLLTSIGEYYDCITSSYGVYLPDNLNIIVNSILLYLSEKVQIEIKYIDDRELLFDNNNLLVELTEDNTYLPDPDYIIDPDYAGPFDPYQGKLQDKLLKDVFTLQTTYFKFINYQAPLDGNPDTTGLPSKETKTFKEDALSIIRDLNGNVIN